MALFLGKFQYVIDEKGRVNIPARFREQLEGEDSILAVFKGTDGCVFVYPMGTLNKFIDEFDKSRFKSNEEARAYKRAVADGGFTGRPDSQGRITLTEEQRQHAGLTRDVLIFGNFERIEIWDPERYARQMARTTSENFDQKAAEFFGD